MATFTRFEDMQIWRDGRELVRQIYAVCRTENFSKDWGLKDQIQRAAVSVCSNIAEGYERSGNKEFAKFLWIAKGSAGEVASQLYHALDNKYINQNEFDCLYNSANGLCAKIYRLIQVISSDIKYKKV